ncbi:MAG: ABC transporter substrate-binding protein [Alphaproteobacteria bacterium]|nr:ABC transporter substrate-binding protein [Alphaproteobacteria bacterium]
MTDKTTFARRKTRRVFLKSAAALGALATLPASIRLGHAADPIILGDLNSYSRFAAFTIPYRKGWQLALEEINAAGGVLGRPLAVETRDDGATPADAQRTANELVTRAGAEVLFGTLLSHVGLAVSDFAARRNVPYLAAEPLTDALIGDGGNAMTYRLRPGTFTQANMLAEAASKLPAKRWATIAPNYEYGQSAVAAFQQALKARRPDVEFVAEQWPGLGKIDAGASVTALQGAAPEAVFNVLFGGDLAKFVREARVRGFLETFSGVSMLTGEPEWLDPLGAEAPVGWIATGYPWHEYESPAHDAFRQAYEAAHDDYPRLGSVVGYVSLKAIAQAIEKAGSTDADAVAAAFNGLTVGGPFGDVTFQDDRQSTMGAFVGTIGLIDGKPRLTDWTFKDGSDYLNQSPPA